MNLDRHRLFTISSMLIIFCFLAGMYFFYLQPKIVENNKKNDQIETEQQLLSVIETNIQEKKESGEKNTFELQKSVPIKPLTDQLLIDIEKAELLSETTIQNMVFSDGEVEVDSTDDIGILQQQFDKSTSLETEEETKEENSEETELSSIEMPSGMKEMTATLEIQAQDYFGLEKFISEMENNERIVLVRNINFSGEEEKTTVSDEENQLVTFYVTFSVFYMPELVDLQESLPKLDVPSPGNKINPFAN
ncbi:MULTISPECIES: hypothetical protein [Bacillaceae]|uniref:Type IV pilus assembly protein PilO n=1 Tax=Niallia hominis TaxID=3133173 RepID=A0ABV1EYQ3_9BACI|nr:MULTISPECIES: hypothetical protein [unclassified Bacillus (in: firmicutes)]